LATEPEDVVTPEMKSWIGREAPLGRDVVEKGAIKRFADAIKDPNPLYRDEEYAKKTPYGGIIAPPTIIHSLRGLGSGNLRPPMPWTKTTTLNGGNDFEFFEPIRPGDVLTGTARLEDIRSRMTRGLGPMVITVTVMTYTNQKGEVVAKQTATGLTYETKG